ncbi:hypothetical protein ACO0LB_16930 [Undibacterium sp. SXout7W]
MRHILRKRKLFTAFNTVIEQSIRRTTTIVDTSSIPQMGIE